MTQTGIAVFIYIMLVSAYLSYAAATAYFSSSTVVLDMRLLTALIGAGIALHASGRG
jgi:hypothetical protein